MSEEITTMWEVQDVTDLCDLKPGESPLVVSIFHADQFPGGANALEELAIITAEDAELGEYEVDTFGYTDVSGRGEIVYAGSVTKHDTKTIVMAEFR